MEIREATYSDSYGIEELLMQYQEEVIKTNPEIFFRGLNRAKITHTITTQIDRQDINVTVVEHKNKIVGFTRSMSHAYWYTDVVVVEMDMIFIERSIRKSILGGRVFSFLVKAFEKWVISMKADISGISSLSGVEHEKVQQMIERHGYTTVGFRSLKLTGATNGL